MNKLLQNSKHYKELTRIIDNSHLEKMVTEGEIASYGGEDHSKQKEQYMQRLRKGK